MLGRVEFGAGGDKIHVSSSDLQIVASGDIDLEPTGGQVFANADILPASDGSKDLGSPAKEWKDLYIDGVAYIDSLQADQLGAALNCNDQAMTNVDINGGAIDGTIIGAAVVAAGSFAAIVGTSLSVGDGNITNVADIALDSISADGSDIEVTLTDNRSDSFSFKESTNLYMKFDTSNGAEAIKIKKPLVPTDDDTVDLGSSTAEFKDLYLDGVAYIDELRADALGAALNCGSHALTNVNIDTGAIELVALNIDGGTDIAAALVDGDLIVVDDGAGGSNKKCAMSRVVTYIQSQLVQKATLEIASAVAADTDVDLTFTVDGDWTDADSSQREIYVNGQLMLEGASAAANKDFYPGSSAGRVKFEFGLEVGDVVQAVLRAG